MNQKHRPGRPSYRRSNSAKSGGILNGAANTVITGGTFTSVVATKGPPAKLIVEEDTGFKRLQDHVAASAFHNSAQRVDPPRCHEGTRQAVLDEIISWIVEDRDIRSTSLAWLNGAAGAGKSAICQSIAELCIAQKILVASFFFFRSDVSRNTLDPLVATLSYQLIQLIPETKDFISRSVKSNPLIFKQDFSTQMNALFIQPLRRFRPVVTQSLLLIIDGLDECDGYTNQMSLVRCIASLLKKQDIPLIVLFGSRSENQIKMAFNAHDVDQQLLRLPLDDHYLPDNDIRHFLNDSFCAIKRNHPFKDHLIMSWPSPVLVQEIVEKSSGQFVYASVVVKFVSLPHSNPAVQLDIVRGLRPRGRSTPFAELDALYRHIFSQVQDLPMTLSLLAYVIIGQRPFIYLCSFFFRIDVTDVHTALSNLTSVIACKESQITFLHASLPDFLIDRSRSQEYCVSNSQWCNQLCILWFENMSSNRVKMTESYDSSIVDFLTHADGNSTELKECIINFRPIPRKSAVFLSDHNLTADYLSCIKKMDFNDGGAIYRQQLQVLTRYVIASRPSNYTLYFTGHDIEQIVTASLKESVLEREARSLPRKNSLKVWAKRIVMAKLSKSNVK